MRKIHCLIEEHHSLEDCLERLETLTEPCRTRPWRVGRDIPCLWLRFKHLIICLRWGQYRYWPGFKRLVERHIGVLTAHLNTRWLVSICDTYADFGDPAEARNAMLVSLAANTERFSRTLRLLENPADAPAADPGTLRILAEKNLPLWDGMSTLRLATGPDTVTNLLFRLSCLMAPTPALDALFRTVLKRLLAEPGSTLHRLRAADPGPFRYLEPFFRARRKPFFPARAAYAVHGAVWAVAFWWTHLQRAVTRRLSRSKPFPISALSRPDDPDEK